MIDKASANDVKPPDGQIRIVSTDGAPSHSPMGRVEMFIKGKWGTICNRGWSDNSAMVACK